MEKPTPDRRFPSGRGNPLKGLPAETSIRQEGPTITGREGPAGADPLRWGLVGTGGVAGFFAADLKAAENALPVAVASRDAGRAAAFADMLGIPAHYGDAEHMFADDTVELVYIATPPATHHALARAALKAGKHVVVEKPIATNAAQAADLVDGAKHAGLFLMEAMWMKFSPVVQDLLRIVEDGAVGTVQSVRASFGLPFPAGVGSRWSADLGGGALFDQGIYPFTLARMLLGEAASFSASGMWHASGVDTTERVTVEYPHGRFAQLASSMVEYIEPSASVNGTDGWITLEAPFWATRSMTVHRGGIASALMEPERLEYKVEGNGYVPMIRAIGSAVREGLLEHPVHSHADTLAILDILERVRASLADSKSDGPTRVGTA